MNRQKGIAPILIILLIAAAVGGYLIYTNYSNNQIKVNGPTPAPTGSAAIPVPTSDRETANWKTYEDQENGFSFKYPNNWNIDNSYKTVDGSIRFFKAGDKVRYTYMMTKGNEQLIVAVQTDQSFGMIQQQLNIGDSSITTTGKKTLKYAAGAYILLGPSDKKVLSVYTPQYPNDGYLDQILSTFKFQ